MNFEAELSHAIGKFQTQINELAQRAVVATISAAFVHGGTELPGSLARPVGRPPGRSRPKRRETELRELSDRFCAFVRHHPGLRIEQINKQLGTTTKDLALPIRKLIAERAITTKNKKRSTTYFPGTPAKKARA